MGNKQETKYPVVTVHALEGNETLFDHAPIHFDTGVTKLHGKNPQFKFELGWLHREDFDDMVKEVWNWQVTGKTPHPKVE